MNKNTHKSMMLTLKYALPNNPMVMNLTEFDNTLFEILEENDTLNLTIPPTFDINCIIQSMIYKKELTQTHTMVNSTIKNVEKEKLDIIVCKNRWQNTENTFFGATRFWVDTDDIVKTITKICSKIITIYK